MAKAYTQEVRDKALALLREKNDLQEVSKMTGISTKTLGVWQVRERSGGGSKKKKKVSRKKVAAKPPITALAHVSKIDIGSFDATDSNGSALPPNASPAQLREENTRLREKLNKMTVLYLDLVRTYVG